MGFVDKDGLPSRSAEWILNPLCVFLTHSVSFLAVKYGLSGMLFLELFYLR